MNFKKLFKQTWVFSKNYRIRPIRIGTLQEIIFHCQIKKSYWKPVVDEQNNLINTSTEITNSFNDMIGNITDWMSIINDTIQLVTNN